MMSHCLNVEIIILHAQLCVLGCYPSLWWEAWLWPHGGGHSENDPLWAWKWHKPWSDIFGTPTRMRGLKLMFCVFYITNIYHRLLWHSRNIILEDRRPELGLALSLSPCVNLGAPCHPMGTQRGSKGNWVILISLKLLISNECCGIMWPNQPGLHNFVLVA